MTEFKHEGDDYEIISAGDIKLTDGTSGPHTLQDLIGGGASILGDLTDVYIYAPTQDQVLAYNSSSGTWSPATLVVPWGEFETTGISATGNIDATIAPSSDGMAVWKFIITRTDSTGNMAEVEVSCVWDHSANSVEYRQAKTTDIGDTSDITFSVDHDGTNIRFRATVTAGTWTVSGVRYYKEV